MQSGSSGGSSDSATSWADVASALVGAPPGFKVFRHSPLGWRHSVHLRGPPSAVLTSILDSPPVASGLFQGVIRRRWPTFWFSYYTPCATHYELKYCRRVLTRATVDNVQRSVFDKSAIPISSAAQKQVRSVAHGIASNQQTWIVRIMAYLVTKLLGWLYGSDIYVDESAVKTIRTLQRTHTLIYAPTHKSHLDSVIMGYTMFAYGLEPPHIVAGDNLNLPLVSYMMRGSGAFFIRRSNKTCTDRELYKKILAGFIEALLSHGKHIEFFIEGGRSRDGCVWQPRLGILGNIVDAFIDSDLPKEGNVAVIPVHVSYDHPFEEDVMVHELLGHPKQKETLWGFIKGLCKLLYLCWTQKPKGLGTGGRCGCAMVAFGKPMHLKMLFRSLSRQNKSFFRTRSRAVSAPRRLSSSAGDNRSYWLQSAFPPQSDERFYAVSTLGNAIHSQLRRMYVIPASTVIYCALFTNYFLNSEKGEKVTATNVLKVISHLQKMLDRAGAQFMRLDTRSEKSAMLRIRSFVERMDNWVEVTDSSSPNEEVAFSIRPCVSSSVMFYIRSNHLLGRLAPRSLIACALIACIHGFEEGTSDLEGASRFHNSPQPSEFARVPAATKSSIIAAAFWLREILSPEMDSLLGKEVFRTNAEITKCLNTMLDDGVFVPYNPPAKPPVRRASSIEGSIASLVDHDHRRSYERIVDNLIFGVMEDMEVRGRFSMQFESDLQKMKDVPVHVRSTIQQTSSFTVPFTMQPTASHVSVPPSVESAVHLSEFSASSPDSDNELITFAEAVGSGSDSYSFFCGPLIATYLHLFQVLLFLFKKKGQYEEKELVESLMAGLEDGWKSSTTENLCLRPIPCITIVQKFVGALKTPRNLAEEFPFSPYPSLTAPQACGRLSTSRPPRPSLGSDPRLRTVIENTDSSNNWATTSGFADTQASDYSAVDPFLHVRREFRDGAMAMYSSKLSLFLMSKQDTFF